jgi:adenylyl- and sulfurtransferase ThiI
MENRVVVGMSGGVDSSVAALLLKQQGFEVHGLFMSNWEEDEEGYCNNARDYQDAREAAERIGVPLHRISCANTMRAGRRTRTSSAIARSSSAFASTTLAGSAAAGSLPAITRVPTGRGAC